jgi:tetratricopeptide (TPR) repeat protein
VASADQLNPMDGALLTFVVGAGQAIPWLDECVVGMRKDSVASVRSIDEGGSSGAILHRVVLVGVAYIVPGKSTEFLGEASSSESTVSEGTTIQKPEPHDLLLSTEMCAKMSEDCRTAANGIVMEKDVSRKKLRSAISMYHKALEWNKRALELERDETTVRILLNVALVLGKLDDWKSVLLYCDAALNIDPENAKAYFRRGQAGSKLGFHIRSIKDLERAAELAPGDPAIRAELSRAKLASRDLLKKTRREFAEVYNVMVQSPIYKTVEL